MRTEWKKWLNKHHQLLMISVAIWLFAFGCKTIFFSEHQYFDQDAVRDYLFIKQHLEQKDFYIPLGPAAASYSNFSVLPGYYYLQLLAQSLGADYFYAMVWMIMILESCTPVLLYWYLQKLWPQGRKLSLLAIVSWCLAPMIMSASTASWNPNLIPLVTLFFLLSSHLWLFERRQIGLLGVILSFVAFANLHFQWFILLLAGLMCLLMALKRWRVSRKTILVGVIIALVTVSPYLHFEITHGWSNVRAALAFIGQSGTSERLRKPIFWLYFFPGFYGRAISGHLFLSDWQRLYEKTSEVVFSPDDYYGGNFLGSDVGICLATLGIVGERIKIALARLSVAICHLVECSHYSQAVLQR